jgi:hypothetical protein
MRWVFRTRSHSILSPHTIFTTQIPYRHINLTLLCEMIQLLSKIGSAELHLKTRKSSRRHYCGKKQNIHLVEHDHIPSYLHITSLRHKSHTDTSISLFCVRWSSYCQKSVPRHYISRHGNPQEGTIYCGKKEKIPLLQHDQIVSYLHIAYFRSKSHTDTSISLFCVRWSSYCQKSVPRHKSRLANRHEGIYFGKKEKIPLLQHDQIVSYLHIPPLRHKSCAHRSMLVFSTRKRIGVWFDDTRRENVAESSICTGHSHCATRSRSL